MPTTPPGPSFGPRMRPADAILWTIEHDPVLRSTIVGVAVLDGTPDWKALVERIDRLTRVVWPLRQKAVSPPLRSGPPRWVTDPDFDLSFHLRRVRLPESGGLPAVLALGGQMASAAFDRSRPLWEALFVEGLDDGRSALIMKLHHSLTDGVGAIELYGHLVDPIDGTEPEPVPDPPVVSADGRDLLGAALTDLGGDLAHLASRLPGWFTGVAQKALDDPADALAEARKTASSIGKLLKPAPTPLSPILRSRGLARELRAFDVPLDRLRAAAHHHGGTVNDAYLAAIAGGIARYHHARGVEATRARITMPINLRRSGDDPGGNRFSPARFAIPLDVPDPVERMGRMGEIARSWRAEPALAYTDVLAGTLDRLPVPVTTALFGGMLKGTDLVATNVPGAPFPVSLCGVGVDRQYAFAPPSGSALAVALLSHTGTACLGLAIDTAAVPDPDHLADAMEEGFAEIVALAPLG